MVTTRPPKTIVKLTALGPVANTDTKLLIYGLFQKGRVLAPGRVRYAGSSGLNTVTALKDAGEELVRSQATSRLRGLRRTHAVAAVSSDCSSHAIQSRVGGDVSPGGRDRIRFARPEVGIVAARKVISLARHPSSASISVGSPSSRTDQVLRRGPPWRTWTSQTDPSLEPFHPDSSINSRPHGTV